MSNHTPGPWRKYRATETRIAITCGEPHAPEYDGFDVCSIRIVPSKGKECHANVDLLIAAPDLLAYAECEEEAYRPLCDIEAEGFPVMSRYGFRSDTVSAGRPLYAQVIDFLTEMRRTAIAKAEGR